MVRVSKVRRVRRPHKLFRIDAGYACFGLEARHATNIVVNAGGTGEWAIGRDIGFVLDYYRKRGATVMRVS